MLLPAMLACLALSVILLVISVVLSRPRRTPAQPVSRGAHNARSDTSSWKAQISAIVASYHNNKLTREEAFAALATLARAFASQQTGHDLSATTLRDLNLHTHGNGLNNTQGYTLLRQTITALYPPEFANAIVNTQARETSVEQAAEWVSKLVERWRR